jgi:hypothetical protein
MADWSPVVNEDFGLWVAGYPNRYNVTNPPVPAEGEMPYDISPWGFAALWQYTSSAGTLDRDVAYMSREAWGRYAGHVDAPTPPPAPVITTKDESAVTAIPFKVVRNPEADKAVGWESQVQSGTDGSRTVVTRIEYTDGNETNRTIVSDSTVQPVDEVVYYGTREADPVPPPESNPGEPTLPSDGNVDPGLPPEKPTNPTEPTNDTSLAFKAFILTEVTKLLENKDKIVAWFKKLIGKLTQRNK